LREARTFGEGGATVKTHYVSGILRGEMVRALRHLDPEYQNAYGDDCGPMVRWFTGTACNVYDGDVELYQANPFTHDCKGVT
jgi:hypothetical protein